MNNTSIWLKVTRSKPNNHCKSLGMVGFRASTQPTHYNQSDSYGKLWGIVGFRASTQPTHYNQSDSYSKLWGIVWVSFLNPTY